jgi:hypothetical protein
VGNYVNFRLGNYGNVHNPEFCLALTGERGVGKTVVLNKVQRDVEQELGWHVVVLQAIPEGDLLPRLAKELLRTASTGWQRTGALVEIPQI